MLLKGFPRSVSTKEADRLLHQITWKKRRRSQASEECGKSFHRIASMGKTGLPKQIISKAMKDDAFRRRLLSQPQKTLEREMGMTIPQGVSISVYEDTPTVIHLVLPMQAQTGEPAELSDADLEIAVGAGPTAFDCSVTCG
jgi:nitrile hydratase alpha subunit